MAAINTLLIANRGEIARRIIRTARELGLTTVAVYSDIDADAPHVREADRAVRLGPAPARDSYLDIDKVIRAARDSGADAIHPGYGFLSENTTFADACADAGLIFVGPGAEAIRLMGDKPAARQHMAQSGVPVLPGFDREGADDATLIAEAQKVGFPLLIKAVAGGGGKGMRAVDNAAGFEEALAAARREARNAFGDDRVLLERYLPTATRKSSRKPRPPASPRPSAGISATRRCAPPAPSTIAAPARWSFCSPPKANSSSWR
mgnify:CR=1 FL=1